MHYDICCLEYCRVRLPALISLRFIKNDESIFIRQISMYIFKRPPLLNNLPKHTPPHTLYPHIIIQNPKQLPDNLLPLKILLTKSIRLLDNLLRLLCMFFQILIHLQQITKIICHWIVMFLREELVVEPLNFGGLLFEEEGGGGHDPTWSEPSAGPSVYGD